MDENRQLLSSSQSRELVLLPDFFRLLESGEQEGVPDWAEAFLRSFPWTPLRIDAFLAVAVGGAVAEVPNVNEITIPEFASMVFEEQEEETCFADDVEMDVDPAEAALDRDLERGKGCNSRS